jgi:sRNA-binding carbon storage regulator CsrA
MLVLTREELQGVVLVLPGGVEVTVQVVEVRNRDGRVVLGVQAPREIPVHRQENLAWGDPRRKGVGRGD